MRKTILSFFILFTIASTNCFSQNNFAKEMTITDQWEFVQKKSSRWETYSMIPDPWLINLKNSVLDTLKNNYKNIEQLKLDIITINNTKDELKAEKNNIEKKLAEIENEKNSFEIFNIKFNKSTFLSIITFTFLGLLILSVLLFFLFKREIGNINRCKKENKQLKEEFDEYRQEARQRQEQLVIQHHKEVQKLKGMG